MTDLETLKRLAKAVIASKPDGMGGDWRIHYDYEKAANPQAILELIARIEKLEGLAKEADEVLSNYWFTEDEYDSWNNDDVVSISRKIREALEKGSAK